MDNISSFAGVIREKRLRMGWTQKMLAEKMHVDATTISKWEGGVYTPDLPEIERICTLYRLDLGKTICLITGSLGQNGQSQLSGEELITAISLDDVIECNIPKMVTTKDWSMTLPLDRLLYMANSLSLACLILIFVGLINPISTIKILSNDYILTYLTEFVTIGIASTLMLTYGRFVTILREGKNGKY